LAYTSISSLAIQVGKAIKKNLFDLIKQDLDDHESRISAVETIGTVLDIIDETFYSATTAATLTGMYFYKAKQSLRITKVEIQIYETGSISSGSLTVDLKKSSTLDPVGFSSIMTTQATINFATASDYDLNAGVINSTLNELSVNEYLRLDVTALPSTPLSKFRALVIGELT
jgi:hypothetical protein